MLMVDLAGNFSEDDMGVGAILTTPVGVNNVGIDISSYFVDFDGADNDINTMDDNNWRLAGNTPVEINEGGENGIDEGWSFANDYDGNARPTSGAPWSIGAFVP